MMMLGCIEVGLDRGPVARPEFLDVFVGVEPE
jgi:hypothetical protein